VIRIANELVNASAFAGLHIKTNTTGRAYFIKTGTTKTATLGNEDGPIIIQATPATSCYLDSNGHVGINNMTPAYSLDVIGDINCTGSLRIAGINYDANILSVQNEVGALSNVVANTTTSQYTSMMALSNTIMNKSSGYLASGWYPYIGTDPYVSTPLFKTIFNYVGSIGKVWNYMSPEMVTGMGSNAWGMTAAGYYQNPMSGIYKISLNMWVPDGAASNAGFQLWKRTYGVGASNSFLLPPIIGTPGKTLSFSVLFPILFGEIIGVSPYNILNISIPMYLESIEYIGPI
jgi:hypothetical protein